MAPIINNLTPPAKLPHPFQFRAQAQRANLSQRTVFRRGTQKEHYVYEEYELRLNLAYLAYVRVSDDGRPYLQITSINTFDFVEPHLFSQPGNQQLTHMDLLVISKISYWNEYKRDTLDLKFPELFSAEFSVWDTATYGTIPEAVKNDPAVKDVVENQAYWMDQVRVTFRKWASGKRTCLSSNL